jgi:hypothetical protein
MMVMGDSAVELRAAQLSVSWALRATTLLSQAE